MSFHAEWSEELAAGLAAPFPPEQVDRLKKGGSHSFIPWYYVAARLDALVGPGGWEVTAPVVTTVEGESVRRVQVSLALSILGVTKGQVGERDLTSVAVDQRTGEVEVEDFDGYGSPAVNAYAQALKRAAAMFGVGRYLYDKKAPSQPARPQRQPAPATPSGNGAAPMASEPQMKRLYALAQKAGWSGEALRFYLHGLGLSSKAVPRASYERICAQVEDPEVKARAVAEMAQAGANV